MSATQDKTQKVTFVYSNLYHLYRKGKEAAQSAELVTTESGMVLKSGNLAEAKVSVQEYQPVEFLKFPKLQKDQETIEAKASLQSQMKRLDDLQSRLKFMLMELEELTKK